MTPGSGDPTAPAGPFRPEPDELDLRVRSLNAERLRPIPEAVPRVLAIARERASTEAEAVKERRRAELYEATEPQRNRR